MGPNNAIAGPIRTKYAATAILKGMLCTPTAAANTVTPCAATTDAAAYVALEDVDVGALGSFAAFTPNIQHRVLVSVSITSGNKLQIDAANPGKLKLRASGVGVGVAEESGGAGATILVIPGFTET